MSAPTAVRRRVALDRMRKILTPIWFPALLVVAWWIVSASSTSPYFPPLSRIVQRTFDLWIVGPASANLAPSILNLLTGFALGALIAVVAGVLIQHVRVVRSATSPIVAFLYVLPAPALLPAMIAIFGIGDARQIALITFSAIWPTLFNTLDGLSGIDEVKRDSATAMNMGRVRRLFSVSLSGASPQIFAGLRASLQVSIILMVVSEMVAATRGIGFFILRAQSNFAIIDMWTGILVLAVVGAALNLLFVLVERRVLAWHFGSRRIGAGDAP